MSKKIVYLLQLHHKGSTAEFDGINLIKWHYMSLFNAVFISTVFDHLKAVKQHVNDSLMYNNINRYSCYVEQADKI